MVFVNRVVENVKPVIDLDKNKAEKNAEKKPEEDAKKGASKAKED